MKRLIPILILLMLPFGSIAQNLVSNGGFETYNKLPSRYSQFFHATGWMNVNNDSSGPPYGSPDYYHASGNVGVTFGPITAHKGQGQMGLCTYHGGIGSFREYVATKLKSPLEQGKVYECSFYLTNGNGGAYGAGSDNFGAVFSKDPLDQKTHEPVLTTPQFEINKVIYHDSVWVRYSFTFVADNASEYMTMGNFKRDNTTKVVGGQSVYFFIDDIVVQRVPTLQVRSDTAICKGDQIRLFTRDNSSVNWVDSLSPNTILGTGTEIYVTPNKTTTYLALDDEDTASATITVLEIPSVDLGRDTVLCIGNDVTFSAEAPDLTYKWHDNTTKPDFTTDSPGIVSVVVTNDNNCTAEDSVKVDVVDLSSIDLGNDTILCEGEKLVVDVFLDRADYLWNDGTTMGLKQISSSGTYSVQIRMASCVAYDTITVDFIDLPELYLGRDTVLCPNTSLVLDATIPNPNGIYQWQDLSSEATFLVDEPGRYWTTITIDQCSLTDTIDIGFYDIPSLGLGTDTNLCQEKINILDVTTPNGQYRWHDNSTQPTFTVVEPGIHWVEVTNTCGVYSDTLNVMFMDCTCYTYVPNAFSPNDNPPNNTFGPFFTCPLEEYSFMVFNRWGELIFETHSKEDAWDGTHNNGQEAPQGVYVYTVQYRFEDSPIRSVSGSVTLLR